MNRICLCLTASTLREDLELLARYRPIVQMAEVRVDLLAPQERGHAWRIAVGSDLDLILTARRERDGGSLACPEPERVGLLRTLVEQARDRGRPFAFVDLEDDLVAPELEASVHGSRARVVRSRHDLNGVPEGVGPLMTRMRRHPGDIVKGAFRARGSADLLALFQAAAALDSDRIIVGMGDAGFATRVLTARTGSFLTYASGEQSVSAAPGHTDPATLCGLYRYPRVTRETAVYGVIGNPVMHSRSPHIHNRGFRLLEQNAVYLPFLVDDVPAFLALADLLRMRGVSVTIPHKQQVIAHLAGRDPAVTAVGACNTLVRDNGGWRGMNTDVPGFLEPLLGSGFEPAGRKATVVGAGGAARSVVYALRNKGMPVLVLNRTPQRAATLAQEMGCEWGSLETADLARIADFPDLIVQTTSSGMTPHTDEDPIEAYALRGSEWVYDLVYSPRETRLLRRAAARGCRTVRGGAMLIAQAMTQFRAFAEADYPDPEGLAEELGL
jgi:3-dehydroquinate dehydratase / shikimate dehydrogenase